MIFTGEYSGFFVPAKSYSDYQTYFLREIARLCRRHGTRFASIVIPVRFTGKEARPTLGIRDLADGRPRTWPVVGVPQDKLFETMDLDAAKAYYKNPNHFNLNGARFYSMVVTPALREVYQGR